LSAPDQSAIVTRPSAQARRAPGRTGGFVPEEEEQMTPAKKAPAAKTPTKTPAARGHGSTPSTTSRAAAPAKAVKKAAKAPAAAEHRTAAAEHRTAAADHRTAAADHKGAAAADKPSRAATKTAAAAAAPATAHARTTTTAPAAATKAPAKKAAAPAAAKPAAKTETKPAAVPAPYANDAKFLSEQQALLEHERAVYQGQAADLKAEADSLAQEREPGDVQFDEESGEGGTVTVDRERDLALSAQALAAVDEIDEASLRIVAGTYGACERCHQPIPKSRLRALPYARLCVACKSGGLSRR
jgi:DnaK suppressor protein